MEKLTLSAEDSRAKMSASLESVLVSLGQEVDSSGTQYDLRKKSKHTLSSWKMCQDFYQATKDAISESSSLKWPTQGIATSNGEFWIRNSSESPNGVEECSSSLASILQSSQEVDKRYYLSAKAAEGILRRATRRGKHLPPRLEKALMQVAQNLDREIQ